MIKSQFEKVELTVISCQSVEGWACFFFSWFQLYTERITVMGLQNVMSSYVEVLQIIQIEKPAKMSNLTIRIVGKTQKA